MVKRKFFLAFCVLLIGFPFPGIAEPTLIIVSGELPPFISRQPEDSFLTDLFPKIAKEMGVRFEFEFLPWKRCELTVAGLKAWAAVPYVPTEEREKTFDFSAPLYLKETKFFYYSPDGKPKQISYNSLSDLKSYTIGGVRGYFYQSMFREAGIDLLLVTKEEQNFKLLRFGRVDLVPALEPLGWHMIKKLFPAEEFNRFFTLKKPLHIGANYLMTAKKYPNGKQLLVRFNAALKKTQDDGIYKQIANRHGLKLAY